MVADGLPLFDGVQLAIDTTFMFAVQGDGEPSRGAADKDGVRARRRKEQTYPELVQPGVRARFVVLGLEVGGRWLSIISCAAARAFAASLLELRGGQGADGQGATVPRGRT